MSKQQDTARQASTRSIREILSNIQRHDGSAVATSPEPDPDQEKRKLENDDLRNDLGQKKQYGTWLLGTLIGQLVVMNLVFIAAGVGCLRFKESQLELYLGGTLLEVFGLVAVIVKYLFSDKKKGQAA